MCIHQDLPKDTLGLLRHYSNLCCGFHSTERPGAKASNSELKRWLDKKSVLFDGISHDWKKDPSEYLKTSLCSDCDSTIFQKPEITLHPKGRSISL